MISAVTKSADDTRELAAVVATLARPGDVILLAGDLGAGKTTFVQEFGKGLGVDEPIVSPTFILVRTYPGRLPLVHCDVYRLEHLQEVADLGLSEMLDEGGVVLVEWGDVVAPALQADFLEVRIEFGETEDERRLAARFFGPSWAGRMNVLAGALGQWRT
jgi:tRNA threonylcarbamoyladenosine biosynthesis protein TsaE